MLSIDIVAEGLGPASKQFVRLCGHPIGNPTLSEVWMGWGRIEGKWIEWEEGREWELRLIYKMRKDSFTINK